MIGVELVDSFDHVQVFAVLHGHPVRLRELGENDLARGGPQRLQAADNRRRGWTWHVDGATWFERIDFANHVICRLHFIGSSSSLHLPLARCGGADRTECSLSAP